MITRTPVVRTERLQLFRPTADDLAAVVAVHSDPETNRHNPHGPTPPNACEQWLHAWIEQWEQRGIGYFSVGLADASDEIVGFAGVKFAPIRIAGRDEFTAFNLYYRFRPTAWGRGFAAEAAGAALEYARPLHPDVPVYALIRNDNTPSLRLAARLGFHSTQEVDTEGRGVHLLA
ncbi:GNAT family N-acetyltransferase [Streptacidiphilus fuscans]|uniref:GNAT family N-acetyltransferase n=1 Tax=Streptacidiphilus fuscans TaxID=2789292 RepID=A0A931B6G9_9ACTN|nr:GNAT family N-acetyltransferase [Streptacidiphilus fuscans]MBF9068723.1 GNAT family N-acetyltransferase [Streptacidiphilus fuscans]